MKFARDTANVMPPETIVMGVANGGVAKAYPVRLMAYHHVVIDTVGGQPLAITYCSMCRTGRAYTPELDGRPLRFRLVGANHYDAMLEDDVTRSWWYQASGEAIAGPRRGAKLEAFPVEQMTLRAWVALHPTTSVLQPDPASAAGYTMFAGWDSVRQRVPDALARRSWVVGITIGDQAKAYPWRTLLARGLVNDAVGDVPVAVAVEDDGVSFHAWDRRVRGEALTLVSDSAGVRDASTGSRWGWDGVCSAGPLTGERLASVPASQEYWHSWKHFHPATTALE